jgi:hypothetical protein
MEAKCSAETSVEFQRITLRYRLEDKTFNNHRCENLRSYQSSLFTDKTLRPVLNQN